MALKHQRVQLWQMLGRPIIMRKLTRVYGMNDEQLRPDVPGSDEEKDASTDAESMKRTDIINRLITSIETGEFGAVKPPQVQVEELADELQLREAEKKRTDEIPVVAEVAPAPKPAEPPLMEEPKEEPKKAKTDTGSLSAIREAHPEATGRELVSVSQSVRVIDSTLIKRDAEAVPASAEAPWTLQQFFNGEIDLDVELSKRFPAMPMLSTIKFRTLGTTSGRRVATLASQDGAASLVLDADRTTKTVQLSFTIGSMLTLRFTLDDLSQMDRRRWVELMRREQGGLAFLWGAARWAEDYLICFSRKYHTNFYAFSPHNFEAAVRLTPAVMRQLLEWLEDIWESDTHSDEPPQLLTW